jgi:hypothetical protein
LHITIPPTSRSTEWYLHFGLYLGRIPHLRTCSSYTFHPFFLIYFIVLIIFGKESKLWSSSFCVSLQPPVASSVLRPSIHPRYVQTLALSSEDCVNNFIECTITSSCLNRKKPHAALQTDNSMATRLYRQTTVRPHGSTDRQQYGHTALQTDNSTATRLCRQTTVRPHGSTDRQQYGHTALQTDNSTATRLYRQTTVWPHGSTDRTATRLYRQTTVRLHGSADRQQYGHTALQTDNSMATRLYRQTTVRLHGSADRQQQGHTALQTNNSMKD